MDSLLCDVGSLLSLDCAVALVGCRDGPFGAVYANLVCAAVRFDKIPQVMSAKSIVAQSHALRNLMAESPATKKQWKSWFWSEVIPSLLHLNEPHRLLTSAVAVHAATLPRTLEHLVCIGPLVGSEFPEKLRSLTIYGPQYMNLPSNLVRLDIKSIMQAWKPNKHADRSTNRGLERDMGVNIHDLPKTLRHLSIDGEFRFAVADRLPQMLETLHVNSIVLHGFGGFMDHLPPNLRELKFGRLFNQPIDKLPVSLVRLQCGNSFNRSVKNLPPNLVSLVFGRQFNQSVNFLPPTLQSLTLGEWFNQSVDHLPCNLQSLTLGERFNHPVDRLPASLTALILGKDFAGSVDHLPAGLSRLTLHYLFAGPVNALPEALVCLTLGRGKVESLPEGLRELTFGKDFNGCVDHLPAGLRVLRLGDGFTQTVDSLPSGLRSLSFGKAFNTPIMHLPQSLETIEFGSAFNRRCDALPRSLRRLVVGKYFKRPRDELPPGVHMERRQ